jgi:hypothetical protein
LAFNRLQFNPLGLFDLRRRIGIFQPNPSIWNVYGHRFISSDVAWFAAGKNSDGQHYPASTPGFFGDFDIIRDSLPTDEQGAAARRALIQQARTLMFDLVRRYQIVLLALHSQLLRARSSTVPPARQR